MNSQHARNERNCTGCIITDHHGKTNVEGVWAAEDVRAIIQQIVMDCGTGKYVTVMINQLFGAKDETDQQVDHPAIHLVLHS